MIAMLIACLAQSFTCPRGSWLSNGVRPSGAFDCVAWSSADFDRDDTHVVRVEPHRVFCRRGAVPILELDGRTVRCRRIATTTT